MEEMHIVYGEASDGPVQTAPARSLALPERMWFSPRKWCLSVPPKTFPRSGLPILGVHA